LVRSIWIPSRVVHIGVSVFRLTNLREVAIETGNRCLRVDGCFVVECRNTSLQYYIGADSDIVIPRFVRALTPLLFDGRRHILNARFETGCQVREIGASA
jgi:hypothetical protein